MALTSGAKLGPYEVLSPLGAGGMGEVYRARDTRLERTVAIKILPEHLSSNSEAKQRLEGQTLAERLQKGPLPVEQVTKIGVEIAEALKKAHQQGIVHRDLKPANIMLTKAGAKLMDFGLAKPKLPIAAQAAGIFTPSTPTMNLPALTSAASPLTQKGSIVGTFQYMAPEVLQGQEPDARSDLFSFGCVLYEMVTGCRAFEGKSQLSVLTAILEREPGPISVVRPLTPSMLDRLIRGCLAKDPAERMQTAHDVAMNLRWTAESAPVDAGKSQPRFNKAWAAGFGTFALVLIVVAGFFGYRWAQSGNAFPSLHSEIPPPDKFLFDATGDMGGMPVLSARGDKLAFVAHSGDSKLLWVRSLNSDFARPLDGTLGAAHPFWSPDGHDIGFFAGSKLMRIPADGGPIVTLADAPNPRGGSWSINNVILFAADYRGELMKVNAQGGSSEPATLLDRSKHSTHRWPWFLPDGRHFVFLATNHTGGDPKQNGIYFGSLDNKETRLIVNTESGAQYALGQLLYRLNIALVAQPLDPQTGAVKASPIPLLNNLRDDVGVWRSIFSVSQNGFMTYQLGSGSAVKSRLMWFDRAGKSVTTCDPEEKGIIDVRLSPDNKKAAFAGSAAIWTCDLERNRKTRVTFDNQPLQQPAWSPDGRMLIFTVPVANGGGAIEVRSKAADGSGSETIVISPPENDRPITHPEWTRDRRYITYLWGEGSAPKSLWMRPVVGDSKPRMIVQPASAQSDIDDYRVSPDGRWVAYTSDESGQWEIYLTTFPEGKGKWKVSDNGGNYPAWSGNGKELFYQDITENFFVCPLAIKGSDVEIGKPRHLFQAGTPGIGLPFDVSLDGKRLLVNHADEETQAPLHLVTNWPAELRQ